MKELTSRQKKSLEMKGRIHDVFCQLMIENEGDVTVKDICTAAGISVGSFYNLFDSKEAVTAQLYESQSKVLAQRVYPEDPDERILAVLEDVLEISIEKGTQYLKMAAVYEAEHTSSIVRSSYDGQIFTSTTAEIIIEALEQGQSTGQYHFSKPAWYYSDMMIFMFRSILLFWQINNGNFDAKSHLRSYTETILSILRGEKGADR